MRQRSDGLVKIPATLPSAGKMRDLLHRTLPVRQATRATEVCLAGETCRRWLTLVRYESVSSLVTSIASTSPLSSGHLTNAFCLVVPRWPENHERCRCHLENSSESDMDIAPYMRAPGHSSSNRGAAAVISTYPYSGSTDPGVGYRELPL